jgi:hypothetical protein
MFNLLPYQDKYAIRSEYKKRLLVVALLFTFFVEIIGTVLLIPSLVISSARERELLDTRTALKSVTSEDEEGGTFATTLKETTDKLSFLSPAKNLATPATAIALSASVRPAGVHLKRFTYTVGKNYEGGTIRVEGSADTRDVLLLYKQALEREKLFTEVDLPISNFAKEKNIEFSVELTASFKKK